MAWKCKECGSTNFKMSEIMEAEFKVIFDENGVEEKRQEISCDKEERLRCANCGNIGNIFNFIEDIAEWEED